MDNGWYGARGYQENLSYIHEFGGTEDPHQQNEVMASYSWDSIAFVANAMVNMPKLFALGLIIYNWNLPKFQLRKLGLLKISIILDTMVAFLIC